MTSELCSKCGGRGFRIPKTDFRGAMLPDWKNPQDCPHCKGTGDEPIIMATEKKEIIWKDASSYSRGDTERIPNVWELRVNDNIRICVHRHINYPGTWLLGCSGLGFERYDLKTDDVIAAKEKALTLCLGRARANVIAINTLLVG